MTVTMNMTNTPSAFDLFTPNLMHVEFYNRQKMGPKPSSQLRQGKQQQQQHKKQMQSSKVMNCGLSLHTV